MKKPILYLIAVGLVGVMLLSGCQPAAAPPASPTSLPSQAPTPIPIPDDPVVEASATPAPLPTTRVTLDVSTNAAVKTVQDFFSALQNKDYMTAANLYSSFSLTVDGLTRSDAADDLHNQMQAGTTWSGLEVKDTQSFTENTSLVHVLYTMTTQDPKTGESVETQKDELWPVRYENSQWRYNRNNLIDFRTLSILDQSTGGLDIQPLQLLRFSDRIRLLMMVQNRSNETIVLGQTNEVMASFGFDDQQVEAEKQQLVFQRLRTYSNTAIDVKGLFPSYPDEVSIRQWKNLKVAPWFKFRFTE